MHELVKGVWLARADEAIETVDLGTLRMSLLSSHDGAEVIRQTIPAGKKFGLHPAEGWSAMEHLYILRGEAVWTSGEHAIVLTAGDSLSGQPVQEPCIMKATTELVALYVCSQPVFHQISQAIQRFRDMAVSVEMKDGYTADHCKRIQTMAGDVGKRMGLSLPRQHVLLYGSLLHDLGKVKVPDAVLNKPGKLTPDEWEEMQRHTVYGRDMLQTTPVASAGFILEQHHERLDGSGYPHGLKGDEISLEAQIVAVVDSYDAMTIDRVYRRALPQAEAIAELLRGVGSQYRADVVNVFLSMMEG